MHVSSVKTLRDFVTFVRHSIEADNLKIEHSLEEYLRALWGVIQKNKDISPSWMLFAHLVQEAMYTPAVPFDESWMSYIEPPHFDENSRNNSWKTLEQMILYQIADLRRMKQEGTLDLPEHILWLGMKSPTGHIWYNFNPITFLECGITPLRTDTESSECDWSLLAQILWCGQIYE